jgi:hypothetical protein
MIRRQRKRRQRQSGSDRQLDGINEQPRAPAKTRPRYPAPTTSGGNMAHDTSGQNWLRCQVHSPGTPKGNPPSHRATIRAKGGTTRTSQTHQRPPATAEGACRLGRGLDRFVGICRIVPRKSAWHIRGASNHAARRAPASFTRPGGLISVEKGPGDSVHWRRVILSRKLAARPESVL